MNATCRPFSIATIAASSATIVLPAPTSPCSSRCIGVGRRMSSTISLTACRCPGVSLNGSTCAADGADAVVHRRHERLELGAGRRGAARRGRAERGRTPRRSAAAAPACGTRSAPRPTPRSAESATASSAARRGSSCSRARSLGRQRVGDVRRQLIERLAHEPALHVRRHGAGLLVERHDASGVERRPGRRPTSSYSGFRKCRPDESSFTSPKTTTCRCGLRMSARNAWFIQVQRMAPLASPTTAWKIRKPRRRVSGDVGALDLAEDGRLRARAQRGDRLHAAAVLVAERQPVEQIFDGDEAGALEIRRLARADALQELQRR